MAQFVAAVPMSMVTIEWMNQDGGTIPDIGGNRITESPIRRIDDRTYARDLSVSSLRVEDSGTYTCEAAIMAEFVTSQPASESFEFVVFGKYITTAIYCLTIPDCSLQDKQSWPLTRKLRQLFSTLQHLLVVLSLLSALYLVPPTTPM